MLGERKDIQNCRSRWDKSSGKYLYNRNSKWGRNEREGNVNNNCYRECIKILQIENENTLNLLVSFKYKPITKNKNNKKKKPNKQKAKPISSWCWDIIKVRVEMFIW